VRPDSSTGLHDAETETDKVHDHQEVLADRVPPDNPQQLPPDQSKSPTTQQPMHAADCRGEGRLEPLGQQLGAVVRSVETPAQKRLPAIDDNRLQSPAPEPSTAHMYGGTVYALRDAPRISRCRCRPDDHTGHGTWITH